MVHGKRIILGMHAGEKIDDANVITDAGEVMLYQLMGAKGMILYFYPKDNTSGCTEEACQFRDNAQNIMQHGWSIVGVSPDNLKSHRAFVEKNSLSFPLIAEGQKLAEAMGVWKEKSMYGKKYWGIERSTFIIDNQGTLLHAWYGVQANKHVADVLRHIESLHE